MSQTKTPQENYLYFKNLLKNTDAADKFNDDYSFAYIDAEKTFPDGTVFVSFRTGYNTDQVISFTQRNGQIYTKTGYRNNYGNYECRPLDDGILETKNFGFGSIQKTTYDLCFKELTSKSEQNYGCCCG